MSTNTGQRWTLAATAVLALALVALPAGAEPMKREPTAGDFSTARTALREGLLLREKNELTKALARLASAYDLVPTPVTGFELGKTHMMLGHVLTAHELFKKVERMPPSMEESTRSETARDEAERLAKEIEPRIPSLRLRLELAAGASAVVRVDDEIITMSGPESVRAVDPGSHEVVAKAGDGPEEKVRVEVAEAEVKTVLLAPKWIAPKAPPPTGRSTQVIVVRQTNPLAFVGFGVAATALVVTGITAFVAVNAYNDARGRCGKEYCPPTQRTSGFGAPTASVGDVAYTNATNSAALWGAVSGVAAITTIIFAAVGVVGATRPVRERIVSSGESAPRAKLTVKPSVGFDHAGVVGTF